MQLSQEIQQLVDARALALAQQLAGPMALELVKQAIGNTALPVVESRRPAVAKAKPAKAKPRKLPTPKPDLVEAVTNALGTAPAPMSVVLTLLGDGWNAGKAKRVLDYLKSTGKVAVSGNPPRGTKYALAEQQ